MPTGCYFPSLVHVQADIDPVLMSCNFCSKNTWSSILHSWTLDHVTVSCLVNVPGWCWELWRPACCPLWTQIEGLQLSSPSSSGICSSHGIWGIGCAALFHGSGQCWALHSSFCALLWEALFPMKGRLIFLWRMLQLFITFLQQQEICWASEESGGWPLAVVFLYF